MPLSRRAKLATVCLAGALVLVLPLAAVYWHVFVLFLWGEEIACEGIYLMDSVGSIDPAAPTILWAGDPRVPRAIRYLWPARVEVWRDRVSIRATASVVVCRRPPERPVAGSHWVNDRVYWIFVI
jgi:hypothetical protein